MPVRDHFHPPLFIRTVWDGFYGGWPAMIVMALVRRLPRRFIAEPGVHWGATVEIDATTLDGAIVAEFAKNSDERANRNSGEFRYVACEILRIP